MNVTIHLGWWLAPAVVTAVAFVAAFVFIPKPQGGLFPDFGAAFICLMNLALAAIGSLLAWLIWALL